MPDYSATFFLSENSDTPSYPPFRFYLPDGNSRYSSNCTLEDLRAINLRGPLEIPETQPDEVIKWSVELQQFIAVPIDYQELNRLQLDQFVRNRLKEILATKKDFFAELCSCYKEYVYKKSFYYIKAEAALASSNLLTLEDIPSDVNVVSSECELKKLYEDYKNCHFSSWKLAYETYGVIIYMEEEFKPYFELDSSWIKGSAPLPDSLQPPFAFDFRDAT